MVGISEPFKVVYNTDLIIRDKSDAATLCVFYDQVVLPYTTGKMINATSVSSETTKSRPLDYAREIKDWELTYGTLFDAGVLKRLPPTHFHKSDYERVNFYDRSKLPHDCAIHSAIPPERWGELQEGDKILSTEVQRIQFFRDSDHQSGSGSHFFRDIVHMVVERKVTRFVAEGDVLKSVLSTPVYKQFESGGTPYVSDDLLIHLLRTDIDMPQIFITPEGHPGIDILATLEAKATFSYLLPKLRLYHPTQILELRERVADTREGFTLHLWELSTGLEAHAKEGVPTKEIARFADDLIRAKFIPAFRDFGRQLDTKGAGKWDKVLDAQGKVTEIAATPWTPESWARLLEALRITITTSNQYHAFKFMRDLQSAASRFRV
jgi:hypothetical protein